MRKDYRITVKEEQVGGSYKDPKKVEVCWQFYVPGIVTQVSLNQNKKDQIAVVYRILNEEGTLHRIRVFNKL